MNNTYDLINFVNDNKNIQGKEFVRKLLKFEKNRFDKLFRQHSVYDEINSNYGLFPSVKLYPVYFVGNIDSPNDKFVFSRLNIYFSRLCLYSFF